MSRLKYVISVAILAMLSGIAVRAIDKNSYIEATRSYYRDAYRECKPAKVVSSWMVPFDTANRYDIQSIRVVSVFGDHRESYLKGHIHTATDLIPAHKQGKIFIYPMAEGVVCSIHLGHPHRTIVIRHLLANGKTIYTSYKHLQEIYVTVGTQVDQNTKIARLYTREETKKYHGNYDHLHLEIRKSFYDYGCASWLTMNTADLNELFYNPMLFMKSNLGIVHPITN
jgi:murein DD-endopeptidase MepM/ murein hydrolase activator NlpD